MTKNKIILLILGIIILLFGISIILVRQYRLNKKYLHDKNLIEQFYNNIKIEDNIMSDDEIDNSNEEFVSDEVDTNSSIEPEKYIAVINIPKINLTRGLYAKYSKYNSVTQNVKILYQSTMPDEENSNFILASHSGSSNVAYFNNLKYLEYGDYVYVDYKGKRYTYSVTSIVEVDKDGKVEINREKNKKVLTLITCKIGTKKQIVVICDLINEEAY